VECSNIVLMARALVTTVFLLVCIVAAFGQSVRSEAAALLLRAEKAALHSPTDASSPYHERVKFTLSGGMKGQIIKDYLSGEQWRERYELGDYLRITVRNGQQLGEFRSAAFEPIRIDLLRGSLPPVVIGFESGDKIKKITGRTVHGVAGKCVEYESVRGRNREEKEVCVSLVDGTLTSLRQRTTEGVCVLGCRTETEWSDYASFGDKLYPRHIVVNKAGIIEADIEFTAGNDLNPAIFQIPSKLEIRKACDQISPPVRVEGEFPTYPHRMNELLFEGTVAVQVRIGVDGRVQEAQIVNPRHIVGLPGVAPALEGRDVDNAVIEAVRKWVFEPAKCDGVPMVQNILIPFKAEVR
jgi:TonB family protein